MDRVTAVQLLSQLKVEAETLACEDSILGDGFYRWHDRALETLKDVFGLDSEELREFGKIRFEPDPNLLDAAERLLRDHAATLDPIDLSTAQRRCYQEGLAQAAEQLLAAVVHLRSTNIG